MLQFKIYLSFQVEKELNDICNDILNVLDKHLIPCSDTGESKVFYYKMKGDYHRYLAEFATANERKEAAENSLVAYKAASDIALTELATTHPIRCDITRCFSAFRPFVRKYKSKESTKESTKVIQDKGSTTGWVSLKSRRHYRYCVTR